MKKEDRKEQDNPLNSDRTLDRAKFLLLYYLLTITYYLLGQSGTPGIAPDSMRAFLK